MALLRTDVKRRSLVGIVVGLLMIVGTPLFPVGLFIVSLFKGTLNGWLTTLTTSYQATDPIPEDKRRLTSVLSNAITFGANNVPNTYGK